VQPVSPPAAVARPFALPQWALAAAAAILILLAATGWLRARRTPAIEVQVDDFDAELDAARNKVLMEPRVTADVIKLWMRT
jgi:flagellar M-ring protein FliF